MKKLFPMLIILFISNNLFSQSFYRFRDKIIYLKKDSTEYFIQPDKPSIDKQNTILQDQINNGEIDFFQRIPNNRFLVVGSRIQPEICGYFSYIYWNDENGMEIILPRIVIMLNDQFTINTILEKYEGILVKESGNKQRCILKCNVRQSEEVLRLVNELDTMKNVNWCEPELLSNYTTDNILYQQQYYLNNTGQNGGLAGIDINVEPAWEITNSNSNVTVAVIDVGVDRFHEDFGNRVLEGYTIGNPTGYGEPQNANSLDTKYHGVACAGIIAASDNLIGIKGVASNINILPVNIVPDTAYFYEGRTIYGFGSNIEIAEAINWAWHRADILSCSWGGNSYSNDIATAIDSARTYGRNGKGSVVVCSSGNGYPIFTNVCYPGRLNGVITVGAITNQGEICSFSQRGDSMDLVAPASNENSIGNITTTDRMGNLGVDTSNYINNFGGTSSTCPQVSGIVAMMLSICSDLTESQILSILQQSATDLGVTGFDNTYGFGLVNAYEALIGVIDQMNIFITGPSILCSSGGSFSISNVPVGATITWSSSTGVARNSVQGSNPCNFSGTNSGTTGWIGATLSVNGNYLPLPHKTIWLGGVPSPTLYANNATLTGYDWYTVELNASDVFFYLVPDPTGSPIYPDTWDVEGDSYWYTNGSFLEFFPNTVGENIVAGYRHNVCGFNGTYFTIEVVTSKSGEGMEEVSFKIDPNPAKDYVDITLSIPEKEKQVDTYQIDFVNSFSRVVKQVKLGGTYNRVNIQDLAPGYYVVMLRYNGEVYSNKLVVE